MKVNPRNIKTIEDLKDFLTNYFKGKSVKIYLFGSRAEKKERYNSDIDLAFESEEDISQDLALIEEILDESNLIYKVDLVNLKFAPYLIEEVKSKGVRWL
ncbi:nucleotidyltransferase domain-containing protein [Sulfurihydrogenibium sp.]|uniref:nucleotidyltransferase family protein n=1 Tax=Sulfurihydrogenibium sp. TaxID=2053621 RepID=UPI0026105A49|nr:nucleotidyltransferase domain-containing protein [Sulfurihydrogenibium sp.]